MPHSVTRKIPNALQKDALIVMGFNHMEKLVDEFLDD